MKRQMFPNTYKGTVDHFVKTYEQIWFQFFCKGTTPALVANVGEPSVLSTCYGFCQQVAKRIVGADRKTKLRLVTEACSIFKTRKKKITQLLFANVVQRRSVPPLCQHAVQYALEYRLWWRRRRTDTTEQTPCHFRQLEYSRPGTFYQRD